MSLSVGNNSMQRATQLTVDKKVGGVSLFGYPKKYSFLDTFGNFMAITPKELATLSVASYDARLKAFKEYVETIETGITVDLIGAYRENLGACPYAP